MDQTATNGNGTGLVDSKMDAFNLQDKVPFLSEKFTFNREYGQNL